MPKSHDIRQSPGKFLERAASFFCFRGVGAGAPVSSDLTVPHLSTSFSTSRFLLRAFFSQGSRPSSTDALEDPQLGSRTILRGQKPLPGCSSGNGTPTRYPKPSGRKLRGLGKGRGREVGKKEGDTGDWMEESFLPSFWDAGVRCGN